MDYNDRLKQLELEKQLKRGAALVRLYDWAEDRWYRSVNYLKSFHFLWKYFLGPVYNTVSWVLYTVLYNKTFAPLWRRFAYKNGEFSEKRGAIVIATYLALVLTFTSLLGFMWDSTLYLTTARVNETVFLSNAQEIFPEDNIFSVQGCEVETGQTLEDFSCSANESLYFRIHPNLFAQLWSYTNTGNFFYPDYVAAPIAPGWSRCVVTSYGFRLKTLIRRFEIYPELLDARCETL